MSSQQPMPVPKAAAQASTQPGQQPLPAMPLAQQQFGFPGQNPAAVF